MRILHAPANIAGQATEISRAQRKLGYKSDVLIFNQNKFGYKCDYDLKLNQKRRFSRYFTQINNYFFCLMNYDVFHFHFGVSLMPFGLDLPLYRLFGKKVVMQYWGSDVLQTDLARKYTLFDDQVFNNVYPKIDNEKKRKKLVWIARQVDCTIVGDYSLSIYAPEAKVVRQAINLDDLPFVGVDYLRKRINIVHAPSNRDIKGTKYIIAAIDRLKKEKYQINFILVENKSHDEAINIYRKADIVVDDVLQGPYGILAIESMALGKPVLCYIHPTFKGKYKNLPIINTSKEQVYNNLVGLIKNPKLRHELGINGRKYVEENHDSLKIAKQLIKLYKEL